MSTKTAPVVAAPYVCGFLRSRDHRGAGALLRHA